MKILLHFGFYTAIILSALQVVISRHDARYLFVELQSQLQIKDELNEQWGRLQLEYGAWAVNDRIDTHARTKLNMKEPIHSLVVLIK
jgi:cell division protein FtsL|tara:strand:+ start:344 stop:604 length:261 start_codon:yes stop_codon:yes gene_type:complete